MNKSAKRRRTVDTPPPKGFAMTAKISRITPARETAGADAAPMNMLTDLGRQQLALATESACALFRGSEAMRQIQQHAAHQALERHQDAMQKLRSPCEPADLLAVHSDLMKFDVDGATQYWQQLASAALKTQGELMACAGHMINTQPNGGGLKPMLDAWQATLASAQGTLGGRNQ
jgi:Phasin protein